MTSVRRPRGASLAKDDTSFSGVTGIPGKRSYRSSGREWHKTAEVALIGSRFADERRRLAITQEEAAALLGFTTKVVSCLERGVHAPGFGFFALLRRIPNIDVHYVLTGQRLGKLAELSLSRQDVALLAVAQRVLIDAAAQAKGAGIPVFNSFETAAVLLQRISEAL